MEYLSSKILPYGNILPNTGFLSTNVTEQEHLWLKMPYLSHFPPYISLCAEQDSFSSIMLSRLIPSIFALLRGGRQAPDSGP